MGDSLRAKPVGVVRGKLDECELVLTHSKLNGESGQKFFCGSVD